MTAIYFHGNREQARQLLYDLAGILAGTTPDRYDVAKRVYYAVGFQLLSDIKDDFLRKSRGGTGEDGVTWKPLDPKYLAYGRRFGTGEEASLRKAAGIGRGQRFGTGGNKGMLTSQQQKRWNQLFAQHVARLSVSMSIAEAKAKAAAMAWNTLKAEGARTKLEVYGKRVVDMLRDTGALFNSLSPGVLVGSNYTKPSGEGGEDQIFETLQNGIAVGTNVKYASRQNKMRQFIPRGELPAAWKARMAKVAADAIREAIIYILTHP